MAPAYFQAWPEDAIWVCGHPVLSVQMMESFLFVISPQDFYIADASEDQVFVCVNHDTLKTNLYISESNGIQFSMSLENVVYYSPEGAGADSWLR